MFSKSMASNNKDDDNNNKIKNLSLMKPPEQGLKCPRCDSSNTKFCYYNNYSLSQPRHFCKTCRRYWTKGGALRNVPVGGGCRRSSKKSKSCSLGATSSSSSSSSMLAAAATNFQLGMLPPAAGIYGYNYPIAAAVPVDDQMFGFGSVSGHVAAGANTNNNHTSIASSIESLSSINQDLHWKLQQQRLAMLFRTGEQQAEQQNKMIAANPNPVPAVTYHVGDDHGAKSNEPAAWFLEGNARLLHGGGGGNNNSINGASDWNGIATWNEITQFSALP